MFLRVPKVTQRLKSQTPGPNWTLLLCPQEQKDRPTDKEDMAVGPTVNSAHPATCPREQINPPNQGEDEGLGC